jgi:Domain of Unknown Function (DUF1080)
MIIRWIMTGALATMAGASNFVCRRSSLHLPLELSPMRKAQSFLGLLLVFTPAGIAAGQTAEGFKPLFDGKTLTGWKMVNTKDNFYAKDGLLVMDRGKGWLATEKTFGDFELRLRYRFVTPGTDSGVFIRSSLEGNNWTSHGYQIQNMDNQTLGQVIGMGVKVAKEDRTFDEELVKKVKKPSGEWLDLAIRVTGKTVKVSLNGQEVATGDNLSVLDGHIGLQAEGGVIEFQRIDVKAL